MEHFGIVITGGPGTGKTSICRYLKTNGYQCFPEVAREIIREGIIPPMSEVDSKNRGFGKLVLEKRIEYFNESLKHSLSFFDRGIPDSLVYSLYMDKKPNQNLVKSIKKYRYDLVFILPPWKEIYLKDDIRQEEFIISEKLFELTQKAYEESGYLLFEVPRLSIPERANFIISTIQTL